MRAIHVPDHLILPFGRAVKSDLQKVELSAVSADGLYFYTDVPVIVIRKSDHKPLCLSDFPNHFNDIPLESFDDDVATLQYIYTSVKSSHPGMTQWEELFLDYYFATLRTFLEVVLTKTHWVSTDNEIGLPPYSPGYSSPSDIWRALLPIPELQLYVHDPLADTKSYEPDNNFRVDYGFWNGEQLVAVEIDGAEPAGYARDIRRDRLLRRAGVDVIHILNLEIAKHKAGALVKLLPRQFFGFDWNYEGYPPSPF